jgi:hypothetical protein
MFGYSLPITMLLFLPFPVGKSLWQLGIYCLIGFLSSEGDEWKEEGCRNRFISSRIYFNSRYEPLKF